MKLKIILVIFFAALPGIIFGQRTVIENKTIKENTENYEIDVTYPQVVVFYTLRNVKGMEPGINLALDSMMTDQVNAFKKEAERNTLKEGVKNIYKVEGEVFFKDHGFMSILFTNFTSFSGAAHPLTTFSSYNASAEGKLNISDLLIMDSGWPQFLSEHSIKELKKNAAKNGYRDESLIEQGAGPDAANFTVFNVSQDSLYLIFNPYQVGPYIMGSQRVAISLNDLAAFINSKGPLEYLFPISK